MKSLLGQFYSRIKGSQEDIASEGLTYILQNSQLARDTLYTIIQNACGLQFDNLRFINQAIGENKDRPDISGFNTNNQEVLILEAKFWASLTSNQPVEYLNHLDKDGALVFICPKQRVRTIFDECLRRITTEDIENTANKKSNVISLRHNRFLLIKTWDEILLIIREALHVNNEHQLVSDIDQVIGLCHTIDSTAFLPLRHEDFSPEIPRRIINYLDLIDSVIRAILTRKLVSTKGLRSSATRTEYIRYFKTTDLAFALSINYKLWAAMSDTPIWIRIKEITPKGHWVTTEGFKIKLRELALHHDLNLGIHQMNNGDIQFSLHLLTERTEDVVINDLVDRVTHIIKHLS